MAFIKRSTSSTVNAKIGKRMIKCSSCGKMFVTKIHTPLCCNCTPKIVPVDLEEKPEIKTDSAQE